MAIVNSDTTRIVTGKSNQWLEGFVELQIVEEINGGTLSGITISGTTGADGTSGVDGAAGADGTSGTSGTSGIDGSVLAGPVNVTGETTIDFTNSYVRLSGDTTYNVTLPAATGSLNKLIIKNVTSSEKTLLPNGSELIDGSSSKVLILNASVILYDAAVGSWDIN